MEPTACFQITNEPIVSDKEASECLYGSGVRGVRIGLLSLSGGTVLRGVYLVNDKHKLRYPKS